jgi:Protein of unknown function (DUF3040)
MALSMEEQRILAEIENELARSEPALAAYLSAFGQAGRAVTLRSPRARAWGRAPSRGGRRVGAGAEWGRARSAGAGKTAWGRARSAGAGKTAWGRARSAGAGKTLRSPRVLVIASLAALVLLTIIPVLVYALVSLHPLPRGRSAGRPAVSAQHHAMPPHPVMSAPR